MKRCMLLLVFTISLVGLPAGCGGGGGGTQGPAGLGSGGGKKGGDKPKEDTTPKKEDPEAVAALEKLVATTETNAAGEDVVVMRVTVDKNEDGRVVLVNFDGNRKVRNSDLKHLEGTPFVETFSASGTAITDAGLKRLAALRELKQLFLRGNSYITGDGLAELKGLKKLEVLGL